MRFPSLLLPLVSGAVSLFVVSGASASLLPIQPSVRAVAEQRAPQTLAELLEVMTRVAELYADAALDFTCQEHIVDIRYQRQRPISRESHRLDYFYVFNEEPELGAVGLQDYRTYRADGGGGSEPVRVDPGELGVPAHLTRAYSWVFLFQPNLRESIGFGLDPDGEALGRAAHVLRFAPVEGAAPGTPDWTGRIWVDRETYQLLRVEAVRSADYLREEDLPATGERGFLFTRAEVLFGFEKNGMRFPSEATVTGVTVPLSAPFDQSYRATASRMLDRGVGYNPLFRVQQTYREYRFFSVRTSDDVARLVRGTEQ